MSEWIEENMSLFPCKEESEHTQTLPTNSYIAKRKIHNIKSTLLFVVYNILLSDSNFPSVEQLGSPRA